MRGFEGALGRSWEQPEVTGLGRLPARSLLWPFPDEEGARRGDPEASPWVLSLDGRWRFALAPRPEAAPAGFMDPDFDDAGWDGLEIPGHWTTQGFDRPHYTNVQMPFATPPPRVPDANPTGLHRRRFRLPPAFRGRRVVLHVGGAESVLYVWMNGSPVGLSKGSRLPAEFDVTQLIRPGENLLAAAVVRWSDGTFLEDQDHWFHGGIFRSVRLYATGPVHLADLTVRGEPDEDLRDGWLHLRAEVGSPERLPPGHAVRVRLLDPRGREVFRRPLELPVAPPGNPYLWRGPFAEAMERVRRPRLWSAETPALYRVVVTLLDPEGRALESRSTRLGFRRVEVRDRQLRVNGRAVLIRGVNRHEHDDVRGKAVTRESMWRDAVLMKRFGVNAVRTAHYPDDPTWYEICDEIGLYVVDEADIE
ncbi:MAG: glycoside hydrolase family 2 TIM barrel-domain containing protein, partial [Myxococcota bacterium]|nr:glycoside hydrolase family 2 TIM barrel-domain containing protein [Myxococcota bacterium]